MLTELINQSNLLTYRRCPNCKERIRVTKTNEQDVFCSECGFNYNYNFDSLIKIKTLTRHEADYLCESLINKKNIFISGIEGSGKIGLMKALLCKLNELGVHYIKWHDGLSELGKDTIIIFDEIRTDKDVKDCYFKALEGYSVISMMHGEGLIEITNRLIMLMNMSMGMNRYEQDVLPYISDVFIKMSRLPNKNRRIVGIYEITKKDANKIF